MDGVAGIPVALSTASAYPHGCAHAFELAAEVGFDGVEVMIWTDPVSQDPAAITDLSRRYDQPVLAVHAPTLLITQRVFGREPWAKLARAAEVAAELGTDLMVAHPPFRWQKEYAAGFAEGVAALRDRTGVRVAVENMYPWRARGRELQAYLPGWDPLPLPYEQVTLDLSHAATAGVDAYQQALALGPRLAHLHLADGSGSGKDEHLAPGRGVQPCDKVLQHLAAGAFEGVVVVEVNTRRCRTRAERVAVLAESLAFARAHLDGSDTPAAGAA